MKFVIKRIFDVVSSLLVILLLFPLFIVISIWISIDSRGGVFYKQSRVGKDGKEFWLLKFRSMSKGADSKGQLTIGNDSRITKPGKFIRKYKIDEFPQLLNVLAGEMSVVGPRPEVPKYVKLYTNEQLKVLSVLPGLTDFASLEYIDEQKILGEALDPEKIYIQKVMQEKLKLNLKYVQEHNLIVDLKLVFKTVGKIFS